MADSHTTDSVPDPIAWKRDYLSLSRMIEEFQDRRMTDVKGYSPSAEFPSQGNVARLLDHHLDRCRELLWAEVNGGLDEQYQDEMEALNHV